MPTIFKNQVSEKIPLINSPLHYKGYTLFFEKQANTFKLKINNTEFVVTESHIPTIIEDLCFTINDNSIIIYNKTQQIFIQAFFERENTIQNKKATDLFENLNQNILQEHINDLQYLPTYNFVIFANTIKKNTIDLKQFILNIKSIESSLHNPIIYEIQLGILHSITSNFQNLSYFDHIHTVENAKLIYDILKENSQIMTSLHKVIEKKLELFGIETPYPGTEKEWMEDYKKWTDLHKEVKNNLENQNI